MFSAASQIGKPTPYQPSVIPKTDVVFRPIKQPSGNVQYVALIDSKEDIIEDEEEEVIEETGENTEFKQLYNSGNIYATTQPSVDKKDPFSFGDDPIKTFYIGSITAVGLFILYRILTKR